MPSDKVKRVVKNILKPLRDERAYRGLELSNGLKVLLVSDVNTDKASAAMDVRIGAMSDPIELPGLAHFCEHMLFLGTKKYPVENDYDKFLSEHGGHSNAHTTGEDTNYFFDVSPEFLPDALDRFAQFFISPLFTETATTRELNAINSENDKNLKADARRVYQLEKSLCRTGHDFSKFSTGNRETLETIPKERGIDVREELLKFHSKFYSANTMALAVLGKESLDKLEQMVTNLFSPVLNKNITAPSWAEHPFGPEQAKKKLFVLPIKDIRTLTLTWAIPDLHPHYKSNPGHYLGQLIGHEGKGSLLSELKSRGWVNALSSGENSGAKGFMFFLIDLDLSEEGIEHVDEIVSLAFQYINMLKKEGVQEWVFKECQMLSDIDFKYKDNDNPSSFTSHCSAIMHLFPLEEVLSAGYYYNDYKPKLIESIVEMLKPEKLRLRVVGKKFESVVDSVEKWYGTQYKLEAIPEKSIQQWQKVGLNAVFHLPKANQFIPADLNFIPCGSDSPTSPATIVDTKYSRLWFCRDVHFKLPKACFYAQIYTPKAYCDPLSKNYARLYADLVKDSLIEFAYDARLAGISYDIHNNMYGMQLSLGGYCDKQAVLLAKVMEKLCSRKVSKERFGILLESYIRDLKNFQMEQPYQQATYYTSLVVSETAWTKEELLENTEYMTYEGMLHYIPELFSQSFIEALAYGNITEQRAKEMLGVMQEGLAGNFKTRPLPPSQRRRVREVQFADGDSYKFTRENKVQKSSCLEVYLQGGVMETRANMVLELLSQIIKEPAYDTLRTQEQLGYIVFSGLRRSNGVQGLMMIVQSERSPAYVETRVEAFIAKIKDIIEQMDAPTFKTHVQALASRRLEKAKKMSAQHSKYWTEISNRFYHFNRDEVEVKELYSISKEEVLKIYQELIARDAPKRHKLSVHVVSSEALKENEEDVVKADESVKEVLDLVTFKQQLPLFSLPPPVTSLTKSKL